jgi:hypothetical protein
MNTTWRTFPIFISSTFKDMDAERDMLKKLVIPRLEETLRKKRVELKVIDLRWGVDTGKVDENERESSVLKVCLDSIKNNRPFFVALLGERYGWVPTQSRWENVFKTLSEHEKKMVENGNEKSVTELEILFGALGNVNEILSRSLFYFRKKESYNEMPSDTYTNNYQDEKEKQKEYQQKLQNLKAQIREACNENNYFDAVREYSLKWNKAKGNKGGFDDVDFCDQIYEHLLKEIEEEIVNTENLTAIDWYEEEENALQDFVHFQTGYFTGREKLLARLKDFIHNQSQSIILTGFSGCGKSAVFCKLYQELQNESNPLQIILAHSAGLNAYTQHVETMLQRWNRQLAKIIQIEEETEELLLEQLKDKFLQLAETAKQQGYKLIILVDALDRFVKNNISEYMNWLPDGVSCVVTSLPGNADKPKKIHNDIIVSDMDLFSQQEAKNMILRLCHEINKDVPERVLNTLLSKQNENGQFAYTSPLWLQLATNVLFGLDADDFSEIRTRNETDEVNKIENFLCELLGKFSTDAGELFIEIINRAAKDYGENLTGKAMDFIAVSFNGLREKDLAALLGNDWNELGFASLRRWLGRLLTESGENRQWNFAHNKIVLSLQQHLSAKEKQLHKLLSSYLLELPETDRLRTAALYHLIKADDKKRAAEFYTTTTKDLSRTLTTFYSENHNFLIWLADAGQYLDIPLRCDYAEHLIRLAFADLYWTNYNGYVELGRSLLKNINIDDCSLASKRVIGRICQEITQYCKQKTDTENLMYFSQIQVDCYDKLLKQNPNDEVMKNAYAIALSCLGDYYIAIGNTDKAMKYFEKIITF